MQMMTYRRHAVLSLLVVMLCLLLPIASVGQERLPIIDMHLHANYADSNGPPPMAYCIPIVAAVEEAIADPDRGGMHPLLYATKNPKCPNPYWSPETDDELLAQTVSVLERRNIIGVLSGPPELVLHWQGESPNRFIPALAFLEGGVDFSNDLSPEQVRELIESEGFAVFGEVESQYGGISPIDERMSPYWALAEELDIPVEIHMGEGPPSVSTLIPTYRARLTSPYQLENVLTKHPNLRVYVMHYASPLIEEMIAMLGKV
jgi:hypothetical protein